MNMTERVARAIYLAKHGNDYDGLIEDIRNDCVLIEQAKAAIEAMEAMEAMEAWQPIETAPKDGTKILTALWNNIFNCWDIAVVKWTGSTWMVTPSRDGRLSLMGTHWKSIEPPKETP